MCFSGTLSGNRRSTALRGRHFVGRWSALDASGTTHLSGVRRQSVLGLMESTASPLKHEETNLDTLSVASNRRVYSRAVAKRDHLVSASAGSVRGTFETSSLQVTGNALTITADIAEGGYVRVRLLDNSGKPIPGRALSDCEIVRSDKSPMTVQWKNQSDISDLTGTTIRLRLEMINGDLFSLQFQNVSH